MRISDWSSDVCSSDLGPRALRALSRQAHRDPQLQYLLMITLHYVATANGLKIAIALEEMALDYEVIAYPLFEGHHLTAEFRRLNPNCKLPVLVDQAPYFADRSEEHTSEIQSLMRISYAVFCLKKK